MAFSKRDWEKLVQKLAKQEGKVFFSDHAISQMKARTITRAVALEVLRKGNINREPELDIKTAHTKCTIERFVAGIHAAVVVALEDENATNCIVVTAFLAGG